MAFSMHEEREVLQNSEVLTCDHALVVVLDLISTKEVTGLRMAGWSINGGHGRNEQANCPNTLDKRNRRLLSDPLPTFSRGKLNSADTDYWITVGGGHMRAPEPVFCFSKRRLLGV